MTRLTPSIRPFAGACALAAAIALTAVATPARAQSSQNAPPPQQQQQAQAQSQNQSQGLLTSSQVDDQTLEHFTRAYLQIMQIQQKMKSDLASEQDQAKAQQIKQNANQQEMKVLQDHQLTVPKFNQILKSIPKDQQLGKRFVAMQSKVQG